MMPSPLPPSFLDTYSLYLFLWLGSCDRFWSRIVFWLFWDTLFKIFFFHFYLFIIIFIIIISFAHIHAYIETNMHTYVHKHTHTHTHIYIYIWNTEPVNSVVSQLFFLIIPLTDTHAHAHAHTHIYIYIYVYWGFPNIYSLVGCFVLRCINPFRVI